MFKTLAGSASLAVIAAMIAVQPAASDDTFMPQCYVPAAGVETIIKYEEREGPYRIALVNGHTGIPWREQMIKSVKAWTARPENAKDIAELKIISTGPDVAAQIAAIDNFIQAGYDAIAFIAVNPTAFDAVIKRAESAGTALVAMTARRYPRPPAMSFRGRVALVTGGGGHLGVAIAERLASAGATVVLADVDEEKASRASERLDAEGLAAHALAMDVTDDAAVTAGFVTVLRRHGRLDRRLKAISSLEP